MYIIWHVGLENYGPLVGFLDEDSARDGLAYLRRRLRGRNYVYVYGEIIYAGDTLEIDELPMWADSAVTDIDPYNE